MPDFRNCLASCSEIGGGLEMEKIVFTNGCFDILHPGHVDLLSRARSLGTRLIVGINSDRSIRAIKGAGRPVMTQEDRRAVLLGLSAVDEVRIFDENTPEELIREISPDVLVKGGDWPVEQIVGADFVMGRGGEVFSLPLVDGFSTSSIIGRINDSEGKRETYSQTNSFAISSVDEHLRSIVKVRDVNISEITGCGDLIIETLRSGGKVLICGNGGSAADSQHFAAELVGRYEMEGIALPAIALTTDTSSLTAITNDYEFERVFTRQVEALATAGDLLVAISTSGNSPNIVSAVMAARRKGCRVIGLTGENGKRLASLADRSFMAPSARTARIQELHILAIHIWCEMVDAEFRSEAQ